MRALTRSWCATTPRHATPTAKLWRWTRATTVWWRSCSPTAQPPSRSSGRRRWSAKCSSPRPRRSARRPRKHCSWRSGVSSRGTRPSSCTSGGTRASGRSSSKTKRKRCSTLESTPPRRTSWAPTGSRTRCAGGGGRFVKQSKTRARRWIGTRTVRRRSYTARGPTRRWAISRRRCRTWSARSTLRTALLGTRGWSQQCCDPSCGRRSAS
mmetsp:Transcript_49467/g.117685  ORF Transcript_49467/g.117685 Transcript_49467/m.117685 type:complete len:210 (+) Transcript_49467:779-1408(+)